MDKIVLTAVLARRKKDGKLVLLEQAGPTITEHVVDESADRALDLYASLKKSKGLSGKYTAARLFLQGTK